MEGRKGEIQEELRKMYAKTIYLNRKYRSLEHLNCWLEDAEGDRQTEYSRHIEKSFRRWHHDPPDQKVSKLIDEATEHFSMERIFSKYWTPEAAIDTKLKEIEVEDDPLMTIRLEIEDFKTVDRKLRIECELSPDRERLHFLLFLLEEDFCDLVDDYLHVAKAYRSARMEEIKREPELLSCSVVPDGRQRSTKEHVPCGELSKMNFTACSQLSSLVDAVDALINATFRNILTLQGTSKKVLLVKLLAHNLHHLLTPIVELRLDLCLSIGIFREDCESQLRLNRLQSGEVTKTSLEDYFNLKAELTNKERRMVHHRVQTVRGLVGDKVGAYEAEEYLILLTKEYDAKVFGCKIIGFWLLCPFRGCDCAHMKCMFDVIGQFNLVMRHIVSSYRCSFCHNLHDTVC
ncbi:uncharacterized protein LOC109834398 isoform X2 [Asparagus officinalis]|uniref:uncharacterized protein LOC109834398 isoform X2 n=1 Tax=Asparagus officinalis TaxID=4686 RepID=UPI00098E75C7|nr:uncharacterized protein LOC109834398 isoform X2 [Asparagus officinalis]